MGNNIPQGYKATALGIIPQEWKTIRLKTVFPYPQEETSRKIAFPKRRPCNINIQYIRILCSIMGFMALHLIQGTKQTVLP